MAIKNPVYSIQHDGHSEWTEGQIITANLLNKMQKQIKDNTDGFSHIVQVNNSLPSSDYNQIWVTAENETIELAQRSDIDQILINFADNYGEKESNYVQGDYVFYNKRIYRCKVDNANKTSWNSNQWQLATVDSMTNEKAQLDVVLNNLASSYDASKQYIVNDIINYQKKIYICKQAVRGIAPTGTNGSNYWQQIPSTYDYFNQKIRNNQNVSENILNLFAQPYSDSKTYHIGQYIIHNNTDIYKCIKESANNSFANRMNNNEFVRINYVLDDLTANKIKENLSPLTDSTPTEDSDKLVLSGGVFSAIQEAVQNVDISDVVKFTDQTLDVNITEDMKAQARANIGAAAAGDVPTGVVLYTKEDGAEDQGLTSAQKEQARINIGAAAAGDIPSGIVMYATTQNLGENDKARARSNIGAAAAGDIPSGAVLYSTSQDLENNDKARARNNIGAASVDVINNINQSMSQLENRMDNFNNAVSDITKTNDGIRISYLTGDPQDISIDSGGMSFDGGFVDEENKLHLSYQGDDLSTDVFTPIPLPATGGGGSSVGTSSITRITDAAINCVYGDTVIIQFNFQALDSGGDLAGNGAGTWYVGGIPVVRNTVITQGNNSFDITPYLTPGNNTVKLTVSVDTGGSMPQTPSKTWTINAVDMRFTWTYNDAQINTESFTDRWTPFGSVTITTHTSIDGVELDTVTTTRSGVPQSIVIPMQTHGAHNIERWLTAMIGETEKSTEHQYHQAIFVVDGQDTPIVAISYKNSTINQYDTVSIPIVVYNPLSITTDAILKINGTQVGTWNDIDRTVHYWNYTPSTSGTQVLSVTCGSVTSSVTLTVNAVSLDVSEVPGYIYKFKASDLASNNAVRSWNSNGITASFSDNFDWINGGLHTETDENNNICQYLCIKAGTTMTINHKLFASDLKRNGMNFKIVFKTKNVSNYDTQIAHCYADDIGIRMYAHKSIFKSSGTTINVPYGEDEYIELEFDVYPSPILPNDGKYRYIMSWIDGVITTCRVYGDGDNFVQTNANQENFVIGSDNCDIYIYLIKAYPMIISRDNHIDNFIMDAPNAAEMTARYNRNNILDDDNEIDYQKLIEKNPDCRVWLYDIPYLTTGKKDKVKNCTFQQFWQAGGLKNQLSGSGTMTVQGTSSVNYIRGAANTDINFKELEDGNGRDLLADGIEDETYGNNLFKEDSENPGNVKIYTPAEALEEAGTDSLGAEWVPIEKSSNGTPTSYIRAVGYKINDNSCPITYSNTKVNFASCEQVNNMCNAIWYQRFNPYPSNTARDCMEFNIGVQFIKDSGTVPDDSHFVLWGDNKYHMYSIANMGNSKKNVHVFHDLSNPTEVCIEVNDNDKDQMRMVSDDLSQEDWSGNKFFGMRYPDTKNPSQEIRNAWQRLVSWMASRNPGAHTDAPLSSPETYNNYTFRGHSRGGAQVLKGTTITQYAGTYATDSFERRMAKMLSECEDYMVMDSFVYHFVYLERHTMVDNVSKNNFWSSTDLVHWDLSKAYDMDTSDGNNNQGQMVFDYGNEYNDDIGGMKVFNGSDSVWFIFVANLYEACQTMFTNREAEGAWSAASYHALLTEQQKKIPERCWVQTYWYDYLRTYEQNISAQWMTFLDGGQKTHQRKHFEFFEEQYDSSKYRGSVSTLQNVNFRAYTPNTWDCPVNNAGGALLYSTPSTTNNSVLATIPNETLVTVTSIVNNDWRQVTYNNILGYVLASSLGGIEPKGEITITMYNKMYISLDVGTTKLAPIKVEKGVPTVIDFSSGGRLNNTLITINSAPMVQSISGLEQLYPDTCVFSMATRLRELTIGSTAQGYSNSFLRSLALENNILLERLYVQNLPNADSALNLANCPALLYVDATGSGFTGYEFANGGLLTTAILNKPVSLTMMNLMNLTNDNFTISDLSNLISIKVQNVPNIDILSICTAASALQILRITNINWHFENTDILDSFYRMQGIDDNGYTISQSILSGSAHIETIRLRSLSNYNEAWPNLNVTYDNTVPQYRVTFMNSDGTPILDRFGGEYIQFVDSGDIAYDPVQAGEIDPPTIASDQHYTYIFSGWNGIAFPVLGDRTIYATYTASTNTYTVRWFSQRNTLPLKTITNVPYGTEVVYNSEDPYDFPTLRDEESSYIYKLFKGWDKSTGYITSDLDVYAVWGRAALPSPGSIELKDMTPEQINSVARASDTAYKTDTETYSTSDFWEEKDYFDIRLGEEFNFTNVRSIELANQLYLDGNEVIQPIDPLTGKKISLFGENAPSFTLAIDYEFQSTATDSILVSCGQEQGNEGFSLRYSQRPDIIWGNNHGFIGTLFFRGIVVLQHIAGTNRLEIIADNRPGYQYNDSQPIRSSLIRSRDTNTQAYLTFGGIPFGQNSFSHKGRGWIHWCKLWYDDLGLTVARTIANLPRFNYRMEYYGPHKYRLESDTNKSCAASFISNNLTDFSLRMNTSSTNLDGWDGSNEIRPFLNNRFFKSLPICWQAMLATVLVPASAGYSSYEIINSHDKIYIPSLMEMVQNITGVPFISEGTHISFYPDNISRAKFRGLIIEETGQIITSPSDPTLLGEYVIQTGDRWVNLNYSSYIYYYIDQETAYKHAQIGNVAIEAITTPAQGPQGGFWIQSPNYQYLRSPAINSTSFYMLYGTGSYSYVGAGNSYSFSICFSI